jgi:hypothetical protein
MPEAIQRLIIISGNHDTALCGQLLNEACLQQIEVLIFIRDDDFVTRDLSRVLPVKTKHPVN